MTPNYKLVIIHKPGKYRYEIHYRDQGCISGSFLNPVEVSIKDKKKNQEVLKRIRKQVKDLIKENK